MLESGLPHLRQMELFKFYGQCYVKDSQIALANKMRIYCRITFVDVFQDNALTENILGRFSATVLF